MNFGPLEFAAYLSRKGSRRKESATVKAARDAAPVPAPANNRLTIVSDRGALPRLRQVARVEAVSVYEAVAMRAPSMQLEQGPVRVIVRPTALPVVLVLSSHQTVEWRLELEAGAQLQAVLVSGYGESTVAGAGTAMISSIGGFYAFKRGSAEFRHLEDEVLRCTGRNIEHFQSVYAGSTFEIGAE
ncbi:MAG TPA: hypothetical protein VMF52_19185 [Steroidobacteraceae bacterium]|nr:hypothetical protein [Steroidobacteraceae bacterium]